MKKFFPYAVAFICFSALAAFAQNVRPTPTPTDDVVKISTNLIQIDVTVTDSKGKPITDLKPEEIIISENGEQQKITNFSFVAAGERTELTSAERKAKRETAQVPTGPVRAENVRRTIAIVVDDLSMSFSSMYSVRQDVKKFLDEQVQPGDLVAIIRTGSGMGALQQFTSDKRMLYAAADKIKWNAAGMGGTSPFASIQDMQTARDRGFATKPSGAPEADDPEHRMNEFRTESFVTGTLGALNYVVKGMAELPGRKSIMLLSDGFSLMSSSSKIPSQNQTILNNLRRLIDAANRASVVIYTMDARGLIAPGLQAQDDTYLMTGDQVQGLMDMRNASINNNQDGLQMLANETGGVAMINQNDFAKGMRKVLTDQSYYLVGYEPDPETFNAKTIEFNKFEVKVTRPGARVRYRRGFYGVSEEQLHRVAATQSNSILHALTSPFAVNDVAVRMNPLITADEKRVAYLKTFVNIDASSITFTKQPDGRNKASFDIVAMTFGESGTVIDERSQNYTITVTDKAKQNLLARGVVCTFSLPVKKPGGYQVRLAVRDTASGKLGSANQFVQVPDLKKGKLTISGVAIENAPAADLAEGLVGKPATDPDWDTAVRQFSRGTILRFGYDIYNAKLNGEKKASLAYSYKLYKDGKAVFTTEPKPAGDVTYDERGVVSFVGAIQLGSDLLPGDYVLEIDVSDTTSEKSSRRAVQFVEFELTSKK